MPDLVKEMLHHRLREVQPPVLQEAERLEVAVPPVELVEASARDDERQPADAAVLVFRQAQAQEAGLVVDGEHVPGRDRFRQARHR